MYVNDVLTLAQQPRKANGRVDVGHALQRQDGNGDFQASVLFEHNGTFAAHHLDIEIRVVAQAIHEVIGILLGTRPVFVRDDMKNVDHLVNN